MVPNLWLSLRASLVSSLKFVTIREKRSWDSPGGPLVRTPCFHYRGTGYIKPGVNDGKSTSESLCYILLECSRLFSAFLGFSVNDFFWGSRKIYPCCEVLIQDFLKMSGKLSLYVTQNFILFPLVLSVGEDEKSNAYLMIAEPYLP